MRREQAREIVRVLFTRLNRLANIDAGLNGRPSINAQAKAELAALDVLLAEPGTCATCEHWHEGKNECSSPDLIVDLPPQPFSCSLHTPKPGADA